MASNKYEDMSAIDALRYIQNVQMLLPDIQREFCWEPRRIEFLFDSIIGNFPIGACILWKTNRNTINEEKPNLYQFIRDFEKDKSENQKAPEYLNQEGDYYIVLDGQQRLTSLYIALYGSYSYKKVGRGYAWNNPKSWLKKELYYFLDFYKQNEETDNLKNRFQFLTEEEAQCGSYYKVKQLIADDNSIVYLNKLTAMGIEEKAKNDLFTLFNRLHDSSGLGIVHYYGISNQNYDEALNIFVRVNSTGKQLTKTDLLFSKLTSSWKNDNKRKEHITDLIKTMNSKGDHFAFDRDYLMRVCLMLVDASVSFKIESFNPETIERITTNWERIASTLDALSTTLASIGLSNEYLSSYNATMPIAYFLFNGGKIETKEDKIELKKYIAVSMAKGLFGGSSNGILNNTRAKLQKIGCEHTKFTLAMFNDVYISSGRTFVVSEADINDWLTKYEKGSRAYIILTLLYPNLKLSQNVFHQDHVHPYALFESKYTNGLGIDKDKLEEWRKKRNLIPNLEFLDGLENETKNKMPLEEWVSLGNDFAYRPNVSLKLSNFEEFFAERKRLMAEYLLSLFEINSGKNDKEE